MNDPPTVSTIADQELDEDGWIDSIAFTVDEGGGADEDVQVLKISAASSNPDLVSGDDIKINFHDDESDAESGILSIRPVKNESGEATITVTVDDGTESVAESFTLKVLPVNDPPEISDIGSQSTSEGELKRVEFTVDEGGGEIEDVQVLSITVASSNQELVPDDAIRLSFLDDDSDADKGQLIITSAPGASGSSQITLTLSDGVDAVDSSFTFSVGSVNDPPTISSISDQELDEDSWIDSIAFTVDEGGGADEDAQILKISATSSNPELVSDDDVTINFRDDGSDAESGILSIRPVKNESGEATITVTVDDGTERVAESFTLTVLPVNDPPIASSGDFRTMEDVNISRRLEASDIEGDDVTYVIRDVPEHGELELTNHRSGRFEYIPSADWSGTDAFSYYVNDGITDSEAALVSIHVDPVNDLPEISDISNQSISEGEMKRVEFTVDEGGGEIEDVQVVSIAVASSNQELVRDDAIILSFSDDNSDADKGRLAITPAAGASGSSQITLTVSDGVDVVYASFTLSVGSVNDPPTVSAISDQELDEDSWINSIAFTVDEGGGADEDVQILKISASSSNPDLVSGDGVTINFHDDESDAESGTLLIRPLKNESGEATITVTVDDGIASVTESFTLKVLPVNDPPIASIGDFKTMEDIPLSGQLAASDIEGDALTYIINENPEHGELKLTDRQLGRFEYTPAANWSGTDEFSYVVNDGTVDSEVASVSIDIDPVNDLPEISDIGSQSILEGELKRVEFTVDEGGGEIEDVQVLSITVTSSNQESIPDDAIILSFPDDDSDADGGHLAISLVVGGSGSSRITLTLSDGVDAVDVSFTLSVGSVNDPPTVSAISDQELDEDSWIDSIAFTVDEGGGADEDVQILKISASSSNPDLVSSDDITINFHDDESDAEGGILSIRPIKNASGEATITVTVDDGIESVTEWFNLEVRPVDDPPIALSGNFKTMEDVGVTGRLEASDIEGDALTYIINESPKHGKLELTDHQLGRFEYTPATDWSGTDTFSYIANDGTTYSNVADVSIEILTVDDPPFLLCNEIAIIDEDSLLDNFEFEIDEGGGSDEDRQILKITTDSSNTALVPKSHIQLDFLDNETDADSGRLKIIPAPDKFGKSTITLAVTDGATRIEKRIELTVEPINDLPEASKGSFSVNEDETLFAKLSGSDADGDDFGYRIVKNPNAGGVKLTDVMSGDFEFIPEPNWAGKAQFSYTISDGYGDSKVVPVIIDVKPVNDLPEISAIRDQNTAEGTKKRVGIIVDEGGGELEDTQIISISADSSNKTLLPNDFIKVYFNDGVADAESGYLELVPVAGESGSATITFNGI